MLLRGRVLLTLSEGVHILLASDFSRRIGSGFQNLFIYLTGSWYQSNQAPAWLRLSGPHHPIGKSQSKLESRSRTEEQVACYLGSEWSTPYHPLAPACRCFWKFAVCQAQCLVWHSAGKLGKKPWLTWPHTGKMHLSEKSVTWWESWVASLWKHMQILLEVLHHLINLMEGEKIDTTSCLFFHYKTLFPHQRTKKKRRSDNWFWRKADS